MPFNFHHNNDPDELFKKSRTYLNNKQFKLPSFIACQSPESFQPRKLDHTMNELRDIVARARREKDYDRFPELIDHGAMISTDPDSGVLCLQYDHANDLLLTYEGVSLYQAMERPEINEKHEPLDGVVIFADWGRNKFIPYLKEPVFETIVVLVQEAKANNKL